MLKQFRQSAKRWHWILYLVIASFLIGFVLLLQGGLGSRQQTAEGGVVAKVRDREISEESFIESLQDQDARLRQILGQSYDPDSFLNPDAVLDAMIDRELLLQEADRLGIVAAPEEIAREIREVPAFHDEAGKFDRSLYDRYLTAVRSRPDTFEAKIGEDLKLRTLTRIQRSGIVLSDAEVKDEWLRENETASIEYVTFELAPHLASVTATDDELIAHHEAHVKDYDRGPARQIRWARFSREAYQKASENEAEMRTFYDENASTTYAIGEDQRRASTITFFATTDAERATARTKASAALVRARAGEDFAALARELSEDESTREKGGDLGPFYTSVMDPALESAVFAANEGDLLEPIDTARGVEVVKVTKGSGTSVRPFEEVRDLVARGLYARQSAEAQQAAVTRFQDAVKAGKSFEDAAKAAGLEPSEPVWVPQDGSDIEGLDDNPVVAAEAFRMENGTISELLPEPGGQVVITVLDKRESSPRSFEEARADVEADVKEAKARELARADAQARRDAVLSGEASTLQTAGPLKRGQPVTGLGSAPELVRAAFETAEGAIGEIVDVPAGVAVFRVTERVEFDPVKFDAERVALEERLREQRYQAFYRASLEHLRKTHEDEIVTFPDKLAPFRPAKG